MNLSKTMNESQPASQILHYRPHDGGIIRSWSKISTFTEQVCRPFPLDEFLQVEVAKLHIDVVIDWLWQKPVPEYTNNISVIESANFFQCTQLVVEPFLGMSSKWTNQFPCKGLYPRLVPRYSGLHTIDVSKSIICETLELDNNLGK